MKASFRSLESLYSWSRILHNLRVLRRNSWLSSSELEEMQTKRLRAILRHAYENVPFYHQRFDLARVKPDDIKSPEDLNKIPTLTKFEVQSNFESMIMKGTELEQCVEEKTSGSTGIPLTIIAEKNASHILKANELRHYVENGGRLLRDKFVLLGLGRSPNGRTPLGSFLKRMGIYRNIKICIKDPIEDVVNKLVAFEPDVVKAYPSFLMLLAREMEKGGKTINPRTIWSNAELLDAKSRKIISSAFGAEVFDGYGCTEAGYVAWECSEHVGYHMNMDMVVTEFVKNGEPVAPGEMGEMILTPLWNYAMPLIRYRIGDIGVPSNERCPCGRGLPLMKVIEGRFEDFIVLPSGKIISPLVAQSYVEDVEGIIAYRVAQEKEDAFTIQIVPEQEHKNDVLCQFRDKFLMGLGEEVKLNIRIVEAMATNGKHRTIVSKCLPREKFGLE